MFVCSVSINSSPRVFELKNDEPHSSVLSSRTPKKTVKCSIPLITKIAIFKMIVLQWRTQPMRRQGVRYRKPVGSGHAEVDRPIQYGRLNPGDIPAESGYGTVAPK